MSYFDCIDTHRLYEYELTRQRASSHTKYMSPEERSLQLLKEWLSPSQLNQFNEFGYFDVIGSDTKRKYRLTTRLSFSISEISTKGTELMSYCVVPAGVHYITGDKLLAQKIALENNEKETLSLAYTDCPFSSCILFIARVLAYFNLI